MKKTLTKAAVLTTALVQISRSETGTTTTLDIKKTLRKLGFKAKQKDVHNFVHDLFFDGILGADIDPGKKFQHWGFGCVLTGEFPEPDEFEDDFINDEELINIS